jgi:hypothetical protein
MRYRLATLDTIRRIDEAASDGSVVEQVARGESVELARASRGTAR